MGLLFGSSIFYYYLCTQKPKDSPKVILKTSLLWQSKQQDLCAR